MDGLKRHWGIVAESVSAFSVISLGAGVQSTTLLLMCLEGLIKPKPVEAVFADTHGEPQAVYAHLNWLKEYSEARGIPVTIVSHGDLGADSLAKAFNDIPFYTRNKDGKIAMAKRQCTSNYKIIPVRTRVRKILMRKGLSTSKHRAVMYLGISVDESLRMKDSAVDYIKHRYPLVEMGMTRQDCLDWLESRGYPRPPKSACLFCPFHTNAYWSELKYNYPDEWEKTVEFDRQIRHNNPRFEAFVHSSASPLEDAELAVPTDNLWLGECEGMCSV